ncbi:hypothetical protein E0E04_00990 [Streptococcus vicugnae]|uniref:CBM-cenC domain-containing protein n=1 Tax=Streptococcus vicugnae TaxID=2740579 RepID=A0A4R5G834_9STRE|nr:carbohydrate binding domain-containing protein [Streptococcus vicugnae]TDE75394.1 hypothetical protein E0E04_00990 [Streptococcus vicugnae]
MVTFNEAMLSNDRTLAIRVGDFTSENIKSANFKYGYITGDDFTPGGTYAGTATILFTSIVESFKKLDIIYPEIGLLVGSKVEWVKMGKYYIDDIKIDRNANTTEIELMDEMFKLNESFKTDLKYPAQIRDVILEIATKTGVTLASDNFGTTAIQQHVDEPTGDKLTYRDVLSQASQLLGFSCFFNRNGELEVRGLTESGITITADNYFLHGLEKSEVEYQIAGITCETKDDEVLTVGLQTGRSLEIENPLATQDTLNALYYALKDITYYPYDLSYQGHLKLDVGQWVTIKTNKDEVFKVPVLYQSFSFSGGLTSTISADSVAGNDAQYTYGSFVTKKIDQKSTRIQAEVQQQLKYADEEFKKVSNEMLQQSLEYQNSIRNELATSKAELETQIDTAKTQAESNAKAYADEINQATAEVAAQANTAANSLKSDLAKIKTDLTTVSNTANSAKTSASEAKQQLTAVANNLDTAKQDLTSQAQQLQSQASAQSELTKRVSSVEETANGTKSTVSELSKTVDSNTKNITSVTARTKVVEDDLTSTKTTLSQVKTTADSTSQKTATLETGLNGLTAKFENLQIGTKNILRNTSTIPLGNTDSYNRGTWQTLSGGNGTAQVFDVDDAPRPEITKAVRIINNTNGGNKDIAQRYIPVDFGEQYTVSCWARVPAQSDTDSVTLLMRCWTTSAVNRELKTAITNTEWKRYTLTFTTESTDNHSLQFGQSGGGVIEICGMQLEKGNIVSDYSENDWDLSQKVAEYKQTADQNYASLQSNLQTLDGAVKQNKSEFDQTASQLKTSISAVEGKIPTSVGARNYIKSYGLTATGWTQNTSGWSFEIIKDNTAKSGQYLKATCTKAGGGGFYKNLFDFSDGRFFGKQMTWAMDIKLSKAKYIKIGPEWGKAYLNINATTEWQRYSNTFTVATTTEYKQWIVYTNDNVWNVGDIVYIRDVQLEDGSIATSPVPAIEDTELDITKLNTTLTQTANGLEQLSTQVTSQGNTITSHTNSINSLTTGLSAKVSQTDFNTLSGRVTTAENNITAKANELSSKISSVEGQIPTTAGGRNYALKTGDSKSSTGGKLYDLSSAFDDIADNATLIIEFDWSVTAPTSTSKFRINRVITYSDGTANQWNNMIQLNNGDVATAGTSGHYSGTFKKVAYNSTAVSSRYLNLNQTTASGTVTISNLSIRVGSLKSDWQPAPEDYDSKLASAQSEIKQTTDSIKASVTALDSSTVKTASLTINTDGIVMKAGKSTTDVANAIGAYFAVNQNAINLFSDKINVKANMIVDGAITSTKIASKSINTAHLNGKIITADVISSNAVTADAIKTGAVTTDKMTANSINGDRITAGTLDAAKIKAGSITASQIASGTITSDQIKAGGISAANIATGAITTNHLAAGSITADKIAANAIDVSKISGNVATFVTNAINNAATNTLRITNEYISISSKSSTSTYSPSIYISPASIQFWGSRSSGTGATVAGVGNTVLIKELAIGSTRGIYTDDSLRVDKNLSSRLTSYGSTGCLDYAGGGLRLSNWANLGDSYTNDVSIGINEYISTSEKYAYMVATKRNIDIPNRTYSIRFNSSGTIDLYVRNIYYYGVLEKKK